MERVSLFNTRRDILLLLLISGFVLFYSLLIEYQNYKKLTRFDSQIIQATVLKQYSKTTNQKTFQVLKLKSDDGLTFYSSAKKSLQSIQGKRVELEVWAGRISFYDYLTSFYAYSKIEQIYTSPALKEKLNSYISSSHVNQEMADIYKALYSAAPLSRELQTTFSTLGVSHLLAISGFHLGVLSALLFFLIKPLYAFVQNRFFPYRNSNVDIFLIISALLLSYTLFLDSPPSLVRAYGMLLVGFLLYDRGIKIISMQTLLLSILLLLVFFPRLLFTLGFWLSVSGVFYIFLFLAHFKESNKFLQFVLLPFWVYLLMLPFSLAIFGSFSLYHPLSIIWTTLFTLFYPISIFLHVIGFGHLFDGLLEMLIVLGKDGATLKLGMVFLVLHVILSLLGVLKKGFIYLLLTFSLCLFIYAVYHVTQF